MVACKDVASFLQQVAQRSVTQPLGASDLGTLQQLGLVQVLNASDFESMKQEVASLEQVQLDVARASGQRQSVASEVSSDASRTHSILFRLEGVDHQHATLEKLQQEQTALKSVDADLAARQQAFSQLLVKRAVLDTTCAFSGGYVGTTTAGRIALRDLNVRLYRVSDDDFAAYWKESQLEDAALGSIAGQSAWFERSIVQALPTVDHSYLWAVGIGMAKSGGDPTARLDGFFAAYNGVGSLTTNVENRLMASEILTALRRSPTDSLQYIAGLNKQVLALKVPAASSLGVAAILLLGERADGTFATNELKGFLGFTKSYETAALLAIVNRPDVNQKFQALRALFGSWGYATSEDTELSSAFLAVSDLPVDSVSPKLAIISRGLAGYLEYPLVAASILASIPTLEANETLNLMEKAYEILGQRTGPMSQAELICLAVRLVHGVRQVDALDSTARVAAPNFAYAMRPPIFWAPVFIVHGVYFSTYSGIGGPHPGHVHGWGGGGFAGGGFGG
jgi:hypothetical protein